MSQIAGTCTTINRAEEDRLSEAAHHGKICGGCGRKLRDGETISRERRSIGRGYFGGMRCVLAPLCAECADIELFRAPETCETCKRPVHIHYAGRYRRRWAFCCDDCQSQHQSTYQAAIARQRRAEARGLSRPCLECGEHFEPTRADAKFCSGRCKQKHYRHALRLANGEHCLAFESRNAAGGPR